MVHAHAAKKKLKNEQKSTESVRERKNHNIIKLTFVTYCTTVYNTSYATTGANGLHRVEAWGAESAITASTDSTRQPHSKWSERRCLSPGW